MKITNVTAKQHYSGIPLQRWNSVIAALNCYDSGRVPSAQATHDQLHKDVSDGDKTGGFATMFLVASIGEIAETRGGFVTKMLAEAEEALKTRDQWSRHYDYDGMGTSFFKTSVNIGIIDRQKELFVLGINAAYVGDKPEENLSEKLHIPRAMLSSSVIIETDQLPDNRFAFDFEAILRKLDSVLGTKVIYGKDVVKELMGNTEFEDTSFALPAPDGLCVTLDLGRVERRFKYDDKRQKIETWKATDAILTGLLADSYEHEGAKAPPTLVIHITQPKSDDESCAIWQQADKDKILALTEKIVKALK
jgi:hypothetical protein